LSGQASRRGAGHARLRQPLLGRQRVGELGHHRIKRHHRVGEACCHRLLAIEQPRFGGAHGIRVDAAHLSDLIHEDVVEAIHLGLQRGGGLRGEWLVRGEIVLVAAREDSGVVQAVLGVLHRLVDV
jgi:hypothetical protein